MFKGQLAMRSTERGMLEVRKDKDSLNCEEEDFL